MMVIGEFGFILFSHLFLSGKIMINAIIDRDLLAGFDLGRLKTNRRFKYRISCYIALAVVRYFFIM